MEVKVKCGVIENRVIGSNIFLRSAGNECEERVRDDGNEGVKK